MSSGTRNRAASRIQSAARRYRITRSLTGQLEKFLTYLSQSPNVILLEILNVYPPNPPNTITLMVDTRTQGGATKRTLLCIDVGGDRKIRDINADCIKDAMPAGGLGGSFGYGSGYSDLGPNPYGLPSILQRVNTERLVGVQNQFRDDFTTKQRGFFQYSPNVRTRYPLVTQLGLAPQELLDILEGGNYCIYPVFERICKKLRKKIKDGEPPERLSPRELKSIQEIFSGSLGRQASWVAGDEINITDAVRVSTPSVSTRSYGSDDIRNLMNGELRDDQALEWLEMSPRNSPPLSPNTPIRLFSSEDIPPPPSSPPPSPPRLPRTRRIYGRNSPPSGSPPARRARRR